MLSQRNDVLKNPGCIPSSYDVSNTPEKIGDERINDCSIKQLRNLQENLSLTMLNNWVKLFFDNAVTIADDKLAEKTVTDFYTRYLSETFLKFKPDDRIEVSQSPEKRQFTTKTIGTTANSIAVDYISASAGIFRCYVRNDNPEQISVANNLAHLQNRLDIITTKIKQKQNRQTACKALSVAVFVIAAIAAKVLL